MRSLARILTLLALVVALPALEARVDATPINLDLAARAPGAPTGVKAAPGDGSVKVSWKAPASTGGMAITAYRVQRKQGSTWRQVATTDGAGRSARITGLTNGTSVTFRVVAVNRDGAGSPSSSVTSTPRTIPSAPRSVAADDRHEGARVTWTAPASNGGAAVAGYVIQAAQGNGSFRTVGTAGANATSKTVGGLANGKTYRLRVAAVNAAGTGAFSSPTPSLLLPSALSIDVFDSHTCVVTPGRTVVCWGRNNAGQIGNGDIDESTPTTPTEVPGLTGVVQVSLGDDFTCALKSNGTVWCWGTIAGDSLGASYTEPQLEPVQVPGVTDATSIDAHSFQGACVTRSTGQVTCWGINTDGQFGTGEPGDMVERLGPTTAVGMSDADRLAAGIGHNCVIRTGGSVLCWGLRADGQTGTGVSANGYLSPETAIAAPELTGTYVDVTAGDFHTCLMEEEGTFYCTGADGSGQLGDGTAGSTDGRFHEVPSLTGVDIDAGASTTCAITTDGGVSCWGAGYTATPAAVSGLDDVASLAVGMSHHCVVLTDGTPRCWGANNFGQLGNGGTTGSSTPVRPTGL